MALLAQHLPLAARTGRAPVAFFLEVGRQAHFIRPSTRIQRQIPSVPPDQIKPPPPDLVLVRTLRCAERKCGRGQARK